MKSRTILLAKTLVAALIGLGCASTAVAVEPPEVQAVLKEYRAVRPQAEELAIYELDWAPTLKAAKERAAKESRPIFLILVTNSFGNISTGHC